MNRLTIKMRMVLWYTALMLLIVILAIGFMLAVSGRVVESDIKKNLFTVVTQNMSEVEWDDGEVEAEDDFEFFRNGAYSLLYSEEGRLIEGALPSGFYEKMEFIPEEIRIVTANEKRYYILDRELFSPEGEKAWVRGIISAEEGNKTVNAILTLALVTIPFLLVLALTGGYQIARRSFEPVEEICRAADEISEGKDLTRRINLGRGKDEIHRLANTFDRMFERLEASFEAESQFTSDASHELRTPTAVILAQCEFTLENGENQEDYREALEVIKRQAEHMSGMIYQLLTVTRLEQGTQRLSLEETNIKELLHHIIKEQETIHGKGIRMLLDVEENPVTAWVDSDLLSRLIINLVQNAYRYGKDGGYIKVTLRQRERLVIQVEDNGIGIAKEEQDKIWRRFYQADQSRTAEQGEGMGLGLFMVKQIAKLHGGEVMVESELGKGSVFTVKIPVKKSGF